MKCHFLILSLFMFGISIIIAMPSDVHASHTETFAYTTGTEHNVSSASSTGTTCSESSASNTTDDQVHLPLSTLSGTCERSVYEWDLSSIPDGVTITDVKVRVDVVTIGNPRNCSIWSMENQPSTAAALDRWIDAGNGTEYINNNSFCITTGNDKILDLGTFADSDMTSHLGSGDDWWGISIKIDDETREPSNHFSIFGSNTIELQVEYEPISAIDDLSCGFIDNPSDYSVDCDWTEPNGETILGYQIQRNNGTAWEILVNNTGTADVFYNDTALHQALSHTYNVTAWISDDQGAGSNILNTTTIDPVNAIVTTTPDVVGDILGAVASITNITGFPDPQDIFKVNTFYNGSLRTQNSFIEPIGNFTIIPVYDQIGSANTTITHQFGIHNFTGGTPNFTSTEVNATKQYDPIYFTSQEGGYNVNYTLSRNLAQDEVQLKVNRDPINFQIECLYQNSIQAVSGNMTNGVWSNHTNVGYLNDVQSHSPSDNAYITCYNDELLFTTTSYTNSSQTLLGIAIYDNIYGEFLGVPVGIFFLLLVAGYANQRTAPTWTVIILAMAGILATIGFFTLEIAVWGLMLIAGMLGLLVGRKVF